MTRKRINISSLSWLGVGIHVKNKIGRADRWKDAKMSVSRDEKQQRVPKAKPERMI